jgi:hypothetical protein
LEDSDVDGAMDTLADEDVADEIAPDGNEPMAPVEEGIHAEWFDMPDENEIIQDLGAFREPPEEETLDYDSDNSDTKEVDVEPPEFGDWVIMDKSSVLGDGVVRDMVSSASLSYIIRTSSRLRAMTVSIGRTAETASL